MPPSDAESRELYANRDNLPTPAQLSRQIDLSRAVTSRTATGSEAQAAAGLLDLANAPRFVVGGGKNKNKNKRSKNKRSKNKRSKNKRSTKK